VERWTRLVLRRKKTTVAVWLALFVFGGWAASGLADLLTNRFTLPGTDTERAETILRDHFGQRSTGSFTFVARTDGNARAMVPKLEAAAQRAANELPTGRFVSAQAVGNHVATAFIVSSLEPADSKGHTDAMRRAAGTIPGAQLYLTGQAAIEHDLDPVFAEDLKVGELYIAIPIAMLLLIFVFGTAAFLLPFIFSAFSIPVTLGIVYLVAKQIELSTYVQNMVMLIGLGIAIDYSLLMVYRYREEHATQPSREEAVVRTMATAGRAVVFSGTAVAIGLSLLLFMPLPFMRGFGVTLAIPAVSILCAVTLLPVLLYYLGDRFDRVRLVPRTLLARREDEEHNLWARLARAIMRRPLVFAVSAIALLLVLAAPVLDLRLGPGSNQGIPQNLQAVQGNNVLTQALGAGAVAPTDVVVDTGRVDGASDGRTFTAVQKLIGELRADREVGAVDFGQGPQYVDPTGRYLHLQVIGRSEYGVPKAMDFVHRLRDEIVPAAGFPPDVQVYAGGGPPSGVDFLDLTYGTFPWLVLAVLLVTYVLLMRAFRSMLLPLKAIVLNLLSIGAAYGLLVVVFKWGAGGWAGLISFDQIEGWIPVFLFAMLFGLSMDYEVFLVSRMREEWDATHDNERAVARGLAKTGRIVTIAGLVMFAAFMGFVAGSIVGLQEFGFGLAAAILLDVTIIRALLVPSAMKLFGRYNWWLPQGIARVVRVKPSPLAPPARSSEAALRPTGS
jgi:putative drug exporter of the RND superfamily